MIGMSLFSPIALTKSIVKLKDGWKYGNICSTICNASSFTVSTGTTSFVAYNVRQYEQEDKYDAYSDNDEFELAADEIVDFAESNPFGTY